MMMALFVLMKLLKTLQLFLIGNKKLFCVSIVFLKFSMLLIFVNSSKKDILKKLPPALHSMFLQNIDSTSKLLLKK